MFAPVSMQQEVTRHLKNHPIQTIPKVACKHQKKVWQSHFQLIGISSPRLLGDKHKKLFKMQIQYYDHNINRLKTHFVFFGFPSDYIFTKDPKKRMKDLLALKQIDNPFHCDYWRAHLTLKPETMREGLDSVNQFIINKANNHLQEKKQKQKPLVLT